MSANKGKGSAPTVEQIQADVITQVCLMNTMYISIYDDMIFTFEV